MEIKKLKEYANLLMFDMSDEEYQTLSEEFDVILKQMDLISKIDGINEYEIMTLPFDISYELREDDSCLSLLSVDEVLANAKECEENQVKVPKVVN